MACQHLHKAIVLNPSNPKFRHSLGCAYEAAEQWQKAVDAFQHAVNKDPFNTKFLMSLVKPLSHLKRFMRVVEVCSSAPAADATPCALSMSSSTSVFWKLLNWVLGPVKSEYHLCIADVSNRHTGLCLFKSH